MLLSQGCISPALHALWGQWAPPLESSKLRSFCFAGCQMGYVLTFPVTALLCEYGFDGGWPSVFYVMGELFTCGMCTCGHIHMGVHADMCMHTHSHKHRCTNMHIHFIPSPFRHTHTHARTCAHARTHAHTHTHTHTHMCAHTHTHTHTCVHTHTHVCTHTHTCTHARTHAHTQ